MVKKGWPLLNTVTESILDEALRMGMGKSHMDSIFIIDQVVEKQRKVTYKLKLL